MVKTAPLIAPKPFAEFTADEFHVHVQAMYEVRTKRGAKPVGPAPGLTVSRTKAGALSVRRTKARPFAYVTLGEIAELAKAAQTNQSDLWNLFKRRKFIIAQTRMQAENIYAELKGIPF